MIHFNNFMENKTVLQSNNEEISNISRNENENFYRYKIEFSLKTADLKLVLNQNQYYYDYFIPNSLDKIDCIELNNIYYSELYINDLYSCSVDNDLEIILCSTYSDFNIRFYFSINESLPETVNISYNAYLFPYQFKLQISEIPFQTDTHTYTDGVVDVL